MGKGKEQAKQDEPVNRWQAVFDNWILLFVLSLAISIMIYNVWGLVETLTAPPLP